jgi:hypothetical protein
MPCSGILVFIHLLSQEYRFVDPEHHKFWKTLFLALGKAGLVRTGAMSKWISEMVIRFRDYSKRLSIYNHSRKKQQSRSPAKLVLRYVQLNCSLVDKFFRHSTQSD